MFGGGMNTEMYKGPRLAYLKRTHALINEPGAFIIRLHEEINRAKYNAEADGNRLGVRLNVLSDIHPKVYKALFDAHPDVDFYDYTKNMNSESVAPNHHLTYSSTGISHPEGTNGIKGSVNNPHQNWSHMRKKLDSGHNIAMAFSHKSQIPKEIHDEETGKRYTVISGDEHDYRPLDGRNENGDGFVVGLTNKDASTSQSNATEKSNGFFVHYDPKMVKNSEGVPTPTNTIVSIPKQQRKSIILTNDSEKVAV